MLNMELIFVRYFPGPISPGLMNGNLFTLSAVLSCSRGSSQLTLPFENIFSLFPLFAIFLSFLTKSSREPKETHWEHFNTSSIEGYESMSPSILEEQ